ncbi:LLM class flavin-dependent oxidoreductase [Phyllobacterium endophyticum]|uniref:LLM class flavin-dependent oxidoreductase n=1 Tax=Phyllobacterium endophyticum TaxID=1149773 RepID=UPI0011C857FA|nr:LLM class flavin-dependent oxidoreductase [Phyllobacterium endophyticum]TXR50432.1 LLM class flavin-dependent oxidoreductase [Phyllobacterium endophyticum]
MAKRPRQLHFNAHVSTGGNHEGAWRHPKSDRVELTSLDYQKKVAAIAERGKLDAVFYGDSPALSANVKLRPVEQFDPIALHGALSAVTQHIGLAATVSTSFNEPFNVARKIASLDRLSGGRVGWNIVTTSSADAARNFGLDGVAAHRDRYRRAEEFVQVVKKLWDTWEDDAVVYDRASGIYADPDKIHKILHEGEFFKVQGPLNVPPSPQGRPVLIQAGSSDTGVEFAARHAEIVFTAQRTLEEGQSFYRKLKSKIAENGRDPGEVKIVVGLSPIIGSTEEEAKRLAAEFDELIVPEYGLRQLANVSGVDLSTYPLDGPFPIDAFPDIASIEGHRSRSALVVELARREKLTIREVLQRLAGARGHQTIVGSAEQVADRIEEWFSQGAADGFNFMPAYLPGGLEDFVDGVIPILQKRGLFRREYEGSTLRDHYDLSHPRNQFVSQAA